MSPRVVTACLVVLSCLPAGPVAADGKYPTSDRKHFWPQWRGPLGTGVAPDGRPPLRWSEEENIRWKIALPGKGHSTPIIWGDHVFITAAESHGEAVEPRYDNAPGAHDNIPVTHSHAYLVLAVRRRDGEIDWQRSVHREFPHEGGHHTGSYASGSPATDGEGLFAFFGSRGLYCLDLDGTLRWKTDLGDMRTKHGHGEGTSPALHGDTVIVNWDHEGQSVVVAFDARSGKERWKTVRDEVTSWASPIVVAQAGSTQVIISGTSRVRGYDLTTGLSLWECGGLSHNIVATPVAANGMVYVASSYEKQVMLAIRLHGANGDITGTDRVAWRRFRRTPYVPSPLLYGDSLYFLRHYQGILSCVNVKTGEERYRPFRPGGVRNVYASPVGAADRVYIAGLNGSTVVVSHGDSVPPRVLATNELDESFSASPAVTGRELYLRGEHWLYCIVAK